MPRHAHPFYNAPFTVSADNLVSGLLGSGSSDFTLQNSYFVGSVTADGSGDSLSASGGIEVLPVRGTGKKQ